MHLLFSLRRWTSLLTFRMQPLAVKLATLALVIGSLAAVAWWQERQNGNSFNDWDINDVIAVLHEQGLEFRAVPTYDQGSLNEGVFLTTTDKSPNQLRFVAVCPEKIDDWRGTVFCTRVGRESQAEVFQIFWQDCYLRIGPFHFFGDPGLRSQISAALLPSTRSGWQPSAKPRSLPSKRVSNAQSIH
jgi:hypothetical protein